ncbi:MAG: hypothetical protein Q8S75_00045, partial [Nitrospirota bacterium]|nr:hypothetical protein [Nitrospirota bacterium]
QGLVVDDFGDVRCMNCGARPLVVLRAPEEPRQGRRRPCSNCKDDAKAGHHYCQRHLDYFTEYRRQKKERMDEAQHLMQESV